MTEKVMEYEVLNPEVFRGLTLGKEDVITRVDGVVYTIDDELIVEAGVKEGVIRIHRSGKMRRITTPGGLIERITRIERSICGGESSYLIITEDGGVSLSTTEYGMISSWRNKFREIGYVLTFPGNSQKGNDLNDLYIYIGEVEEIVHEERRTEDEMMADVFMARLADLPFVVAAEDYVGQKNILSEGGKYVISTTTMNDMLRELGWQHIGLRKLTELLKDHKAGDNKQKRRVGRWVSEWYFTPWEGEL